MGKTQKLVMASLILAIGMSFALVFRRDAAPPVASLAAAEETTVSLPLRGDPTTIEYLSPVSGARRPEAIEDQDAITANHSILETRRSRPPSSPPSIPKAYDRERFHVWEKQSPRNRVEDDVPVRPKTVRVRKHQINDGDTLPRLAARYLGDKSRAWEIFEANRNVLADPHELPIGVKLVIPPRVATPTSPRRTVVLGTMTPVPRNFLRVPQ